jgi:heme exporter protein C
LKPFKLLFAAAATVATVVTFAAPNAKGFAQPELARIIFWHLPCAFICTLFLLAGAYYGFTYLLKGNWPDEAKSAAATEMAFMMSLITMATGILFSKVQWGDWWNWDPRQTSFLLVLLILAGYEVLRMSISDEEFRAKSSAAYAVLSVLPSIFLIFVFPRMGHVLQKSLHPSTTAQKGGFDSTHWTILLIMFGVLMVASVWLFRLRVRAALLERELENTHAELDDRGGSAATGVVRPVSLPSEGGELVEAGRGTPPN